MKRFLGALVLSVTVASLASADGLPPKGQKRVTLDHKITTEKEFPDYAFYVAVGGEGKGARAGTGVTAVKLDPKTPAEIKGEGRSAGIGRQGSLYAVPKGAEKAFGSDKEFYSALRAGKVEGQVRAKGNFDSVTTIKDADPRTAVVREFKVEKVDKDGLVGKFVFDDAEKRDAPKKEKDAPESDEGDAEPTVADAPKGGVWVAGLAAALGMVFAGLWLAGRSRRES